jgi:hypothetical protein
MHVSTNEKPEEKKDLYNLLNQIICHTASSDIKIILGDFNTKVGKENLYKPTIGNESLHNETNDNGMKMIQFAICKGLNIRNTIFLPKDIHKEPWYSAYGRTVKSNRSRLD